MLKLIIKMLNLSNYLIFIVIIILLTILFYLKVYMKNRILKNDYEVNICTPQLLLGTLENTKNNIYIVNVLSEKMPYLININGNNTKNSLTKKQFESFLNTDILENGIIIFYCAAWSCSAAKNYIKEVLEKYPKLNSNNFKIYDYVGGFHEWSSYALINPELYSVVNSNDNTLLNRNDLLELFNNTNHSYYVDNIAKKNEPKIIQELYQIGTNKI